ncbi:hypothetical protein HAX54_004867, partial [Datura stramonium]|nr:hypothetical protein [Datura stramonium]
MAPIFLHDMKESRMHTGKHIKPSPGRADRASSVSRCLCSAFEGVSRPLSCSLPAVARCQCAGGLFHASSLPTFAFYFQFHASTSPTHGLVPQIHFKPTKTRTNHV